MYTRPFHHTILEKIVKKKFAAGHSCRENGTLLLLTEGHAICALINSGICLMGTHQDPLQRAVVCLITVMGTLVDGTLNALVCVAVHNLFLLFLCDVVSMTKKARSIRLFFYVHFSDFCQKSLTTLG